MRLAGGYTRPRLLAIADHVATGHRPSTPGHALEVISETIHHEDLQDCGEPPARSRARCELRADKMTVDLPPVGIRRASGGQFWSGLLLLLVSFGLIGLTAW